MYALLKNETSHEEIWFVFVGRLRLGALPNRPPSMDVCLAGDAPKPEAEVAEPWAARPAAARLEALAAAAAAANPDANVVVDSGSEVDMAPAPPPPPAPTGDLITQAEAGRAYVNIKSMV